jgi:hypothetical protein
VVLKQDTTSAFHLLNTSCEQYLTQCLRTDKELEVTKNGPIIVGVKMQGIPPGYFPLSNELFTDASYYGDYMVG